MIINNNNGDLIPAIPHINGHRLYIMDRKKKLYMRNPLVYSAELL